MRKHIAHHTPSDKQSKAIKWVCIFFNEKLLSAPDAATKKQNWRWHKKSYKLWLRRLKRKTNRIKKASGIEDIFSSTDGFLEDFIVKFDQAKEERRCAQEEFLQKEASLNVGGEQAFYNALTRRLSVGCNETGSKRCNPRRGQIMNDKSSWNEVIKREFLYNWASKERKLHLRREKLKLKQQRWGGDKKYREKNREKARKRVEPVILLFAQRMN